MPRTVNVIKAAKGGSILTVLECNIKCYEDSQLQQFQEELMMIFASCHTWFPSTKRMINSV